MLDPASELERKEFLIWSKETFDADTKEKEEAIEILSLYYVNTDMPLCGMKAWLKRDYERFCKGYRGTVDRYKRILYGVPNTQKQRNSVLCDYSVDDPSYRGPNGNWTLD